MKGAQVYFECSTINKIIFFNKEGKTFNNFLRIISLDKKNWSQISNKYHKNNFIVSEE